MSGSIILSDDFGLLGPRFSKWIDTDLSPEMEGIENVRPAAVSAKNLRPTMGTVTGSDPVPIRPSAPRTKILRPAANAKNLRPRMSRITEE